MRVVLAAVGSRGDVQPFAVLGQALVRAGHEVLLAIPPDGAGLARAYGIPFVACGRDVTRWLAEHQVARMSGLALLREFKSQMEEDMQLQAPILFEAARGADVVLSAGLQGLGGTAAELHGAAGAYVYYAPSLVISGEHPPLFVPLQWLPRFVNRRLHDFTSWFFDRVVLPPTNRERARVGLAPHGRYLDALPDDLIFAWDSPLSPTPTDAASIAVSLGLDVRLHTIGALVPEAAPLDDELVRFLDRPEVEGGASAPPCVYVGFGSMPDSSAAATFALVDEAAREAGVRAVLLAPLVDAVDPSSLASDRVRLITSVSHGSLFPRMKAIVHHAGAGTTAAASRSGVPQIAVPHFLDQPLFADRLEKRGVCAAVLPRKSLDARSLARALRRAVEDTALNDRARSLRDELLATSPCSEAVRVVEDLARSRMNATASRA